MSSLFKRAIKAGLALFPERTFLGSIFSGKMGRGVLSGPFAGMKYVNSSLGGSYYSRLLGTYELELFPLVERISREPFDTIVNVGAAEGYYAVGLAMRNPSARVYAFEANPDGARLIHQMAKMNGVEDRVCIGGSCDARLLSRALAGGKRCVVVMDIEGQESAVLDPAAVPGLKGSFMLVELHDYIFPETSALLSRRFAGTHTITEVWSRPRVYADFPLAVPVWLSWVPKKWFTGIMDEWRREKMRWFYLEPKHSEGEKS